MEISLIQQFTVVFSIASFLMFMTYLPNNHHVPGVKQWGLALILFPIAHFLFYQADTLSIFWSMFVANTLLSSALVFITCGTRLFYGFHKKNLSIGVFLISIVIVVSYYFTLYAPDTTMRRILLSLIGLSCLITIIFSLINAKLYQGKAKKFLLLICLIVSFTLFIRVFLKLHYTDLELQQQVIVVHQAIELTMLLIGFFFAVAFSLLCQSRYNHYRRALDVSHHNEVALQGLFMKNLESDINQPLKALDKANLDSDAPAPEMITRQTQRLQQLTRDAFGNVANGATNIGYTKIEDWLIQILRSLQALANDKNIYLSLNFPDPVGPCYLLEQHKLGIVITNLFSQLISIKDSGVITLTVHIKQSSSTRDAALIHFDFCQELNANQDVFNQATFNKHHSSQHSLRVISSLDSQLEFVNNNQGNNVISFEIYASEGLDTDIRYQIPRYSISPVSNLDIILLSHNRHTQTIISDDLNSNHHYLDIVENIDDLLIRLKASTYNAIIIDINANEFDSLAAPSRIKKLGGKNADSPIIALTSNVSSMAKFDLAEEGLTTLVAKPIQQGSLQRAINSVVKVQQAKVANEKKSTEQPHSSDIKTQVTTPSIDTSTSDPLPHNIQQRKNGDVVNQDSDQQTVAQQPIFNPNALPLLALNTQTNSLIEIIKSTNKEANQLLSQVKQYLNGRDHAKLSQAMYMLALSSDKLGYVALAESLLTTNVKDIEGTGDSEFLHFEHLLLESQRLLAVHLKSSS